MKFIILKIFFKAISTESNLTRLSQLKYQKSKLCQGLVIYNGAKIIKQHESEQEGIRIRNAQYPELEECLSMWHQQMINSYVPVSDEMMTVIIKKK